MAIARPRTHASAKIPNHATSFLSLTLSLFLHQDCSGSSTRRHHCCTLFQVPADCCFYVPICLHAFRERVPEGRGDASPRSLQLAISALRAALPNVRPSEAITGSSNRAFVMGQTRVHNGTLPSASSWGWVGMGERRRDTCYERYESNRVFTTEGLCKRGRGGRSRNSFRGEHPTPKPFVYRRDPGGVRPRLEL